MNPTGKIQLDFDYLAREARVIASDVAIENRVDLTADALPAVDDLIQDNKNDVTRHWRDIETWQRHVRHISLEVVRIYKTRGVKQIRSRDELVDTSRPIIRVYPYD